MRTASTAAALALLLTAAAPVLAQGAGAPPPPPPGHGMRAGPEWRGGPPPFAGMSEAGRRAVMAAMRPDGPGDRADHDRVRAARDRMLQILSADRLDGPALRRAMDDEREAANAMKARRQGDMLKALQGLSAADRKAFVADAKAMRGRFEGKMRLMKRHWRGRGGMDDGPPPPQPM